MDHLELFEIFILFIKKLPPRIVWIIYVNFNKREAVFYQSINLCNF